MGMIADLDDPRLMPATPGPQMPLQQQMETREAHPSAAIDSSPMKPAKPRPARRARAVPGAVRSLWCHPTPSGGLLFAWGLPPDGGPVEGYRIERTRQGREYELVQESARPSFALPPLPFNDGWFYRVTAFNARGQGAARWVFFFLRRRQDSIFHYVPVREGLRVDISELVPC